MKFVHNTAIGGRTRSRTGDGSAVSIRPNAEWHQEVEFNPLAGIRWIERQRPVKKGGQAAIRPIGLDPPVHAGYQAS